MNEELIKEEWKKFVGTRDNFNIILTNEGLHYIDGLKGKWLSLIIKKENKEAPSLEDILNIISGHLETERRNDKFEFKNPKNDIKYWDKFGKKFRPHQRFIILNKIKDCIKEIEEEWEKQRMNFYSQVE